MKKRIVLFSVAFIAGIMLMNAQSDVGIKAGLSYNSNGDLKEFTSEVDQIYKDEGKGKSGFNVGFYGKLDLGPIFVRPEIVYTQTTSEYEFNSLIEDYKLSKIDVPVLVGLKLIGPLNVFAGPAFQYILDNDLNGINISDVKNDFSVGVNVGASVEFGRIGIDVRYERGLSENEANWSNAGETFTLDSRPEQLIFSLSYSLSKDKS
ncbi:outer membrane beta-barrel protein [Lutibacter flavus]|uniref:Outer membrane protein beta-barrel domain-containing protein n=1 Tax=Lutibacter flavus TaxID=691689 RepID=A0A238VP11_9FLAO|nr:outer membrane beta-barrel protein [Lutibacter flavus]SNR35921.1 Outer membrane protein beta-barrel domain-containing protein [Lutibacter flavus]